MRPIILKILLLLILLYLFFYSIILLGVSLNYLGKDFVENIISTTNKPIAGLFIGILTTSIIQSSSTTTSIVVALVGSNFLSLNNAIPIIMGANIGTTITNTLVAIGYISRKAEYRRAIAADVVHDFFNFLSVIVIFPIQYFTNFLGKSSQFIANIFEGMGGLKFTSPIKTIVNPLTSLTVKVTGGSGIIMVLIAFVCIYFVLRYFPKIVKSLIVYKVEVFFNQYIFRNYFLSILLGMIITAVIQSSSITTSLIIPLAGAGVLTLNQIYPYTLGANVGTTITAILASLSIGNISAVTIAFAHLLFNLFGILILTPLKSIPIFLATKFSDLTEKNRAIPIIYVIILYFIIPIIFIYLT